MMEFFQANWFWILLILVFIGMHSFGGGCCGGGHQSRKKEEPGEKVEEGEAKSCH